MDYITSHLPGISHSLAAFLLGVVMCTHTLAKGLTQGCVIRLSQCWSTKGVFFLLLGLSSTGILMIGYEPFYIIFISRFLCGIALNLQLLSRKVMHNLCMRDKTNWGDFCLNIVWSRKLGMILGVVAGGLLSRDVIKSSGDKWLLLRTLMFLLNLSGFLLVFAMDTENLTASLETNFSEVDEDLKNYDQTREVTSGRNTFNFLKIIRRKEKETEEVELEESKYYSPRNQFMPEQCVNSSKTQRQIPSNTQPRDVGVKKVHISIIEENIEIPKPDSQIFSTEVQSSPSGLKHAFLYQMLLTLNTSLASDSLPYIFYYISPSIALLKLSLIISAIFTTSSVAKIKILPVLLARFSYGKIAEFFLHLSIIFLSFSSILIFLAHDIYVFAVLYTLILFSEDVISPLGPILISDSVSLAERDAALEQNTLRCTISRIISLLLAPLFVFSVHPALYYLMNILIAIFSIWVLRLIRSEFQFINQAPYYI